MSSVSRAQRTTGCALTLYIALVSALAATLSAQPAQAQGFGSRPGMGPGPGPRQQKPDAPAGPRATGLLAISVVPAIIAWFATLAPAGTAIVALAVLFLVLLPVDVWAIGERLAPLWYRPLRLQLSAAVVTALALAAVSV